jgi:hypothetical protein
MRLDHSRQIWTKLLITRAEPGHSANVFSQVQIGLDGNSSQSYVFHGFIHLPTYKLFKLLEKKTFEQPILDSCKKEKSIGD